MLSTDEPKNHDHAQVKRITSDFLKRLRMSMSANRLKTVSDDWWVFVVDMLHAGGIGPVHLWKKQNCDEQTAGVPVCTNSGSRRNKPQTRNMLLGPWGWSMPEGHEGYPIWSKPIEGLLRHKSQKILMMVTWGTCRNTQCIAPCCE